MSCWQLAVSDAGHGSVLSTRKGYVARLNLHSLKWDDMRFSNEPPALANSAFETGSPQALQVSTMKSRAGLPLASGST